MKTLDLLEPGRKGIIKNIVGEQCFISRASAIGFTPGTEVISVRNYRHCPLIVYLRDTQIVIDRKESQRIVVDEII
jgi:ferrous iron transport protein A